MLGVVKAAPQARPKTTCLACICLTAHGTTELISWLVDEWSQLNSVMLAVWYLDLDYFLPLQHVVSTWLQHRIAVAFLNVLDVVKAAPQARPKTT